MENIQDICGKLEGAKHKPGLISPTTQGATFPCPDEAKREALGPLRPPSLPDLFKKPMFWGLGVQSGSHFLWGILATKLITVPMMGIHLSSSLVLSCCLTLEGHCRAELVEQ